MLPRLKRWLWTRWSTAAILMDEIASIKVIQIEEEKVGQLVSKAINELDLSLNEVESVIVGPKEARLAEYQHMIHCQEFNLPMSEGNPMQGIGSIAGLRVKIIPWFSGVLIVPKTR